MSRVTVVIEDARLVDVHLGDRLLSGRITALMEGDHSELLETLENLLAKAECYGMGDSCSAYVAAQYEIKRARGEK